MARFFLRASRERLRRNDAERAFRYTLEAARWTWRPPPHALAYSMGLAR
jgi:hypothetical protein